MLSQKQLNQIKTDESKSLLSQRLQRYHYYGLLEEYQLHPTSIINSFSYNKLNSYQHFLFKRVLHGTNIYNKEELNKMHWDKKRRITKVWKRAQSEINRWKQSICNESANSFFKVFYNSVLAKEILDIPVSETCDEHKNTISFKDLGIKYEDVILLFMGKGLLPRNFLSLK